MDLGCRLLEIGGGDPKGTEGPGSLETVESGFVNPQAVLDGGVTVADTGLESIIEKCLVKVNFLMKEFKSINNWKSSGCS